MSLSKAWDWDKSTSKVWLRPSEESYYLLKRWRERGFKDLLDFGCGLGRHSIFFANEGFNVTAFDLSKDAVEYLNSWTLKENLTIKTSVEDMLNLPYEDNSFDCLTAFFVISHTDTASMKNIVAEIRRIIRPGGEFFITLCSKSADAFTSGKYPKIDENTILYTEDGPEKNVAHFYVNLDDIFTFFDKDEVIRIRHTDLCYFDDKKQSFSHYYLLGKIN